MNVNTLTPEKLTAGKLYKVVHTGGACCIPEPTNRNIILYKNDIVMYLRPATQEDFKYTGAYPHQYPVVVLHTDEPVVMWAAWLKELEEKQ